MKTLFTFALALSINIATLAVSPNEQLTAHSRVACTHQKISITLLKGIGKVKISVLDDKGMNLYTDFIKINQNVVYPINMENLPAGKYLVKISNKDGDIEKWVEVNPKPTEKNERKVALKVIDRDKVQVKIRDISEDLTLKMFSDEHRLLFKEEIKGQKTFNKKFSLQSIPSDKVYFTLNDKKGNHQIISQ